MKLEDIGFYTLSDQRAREVSIESDLQRCELILTDRCNFKCEYCRGIKKELQGDLTLNEACSIVDLWDSGSLRNIRFSGGEPTIWEGIVDLVKYTKTKRNIEHIAISTNGSASINLYEQLRSAGVNDFSISLDACCSSTANIMAGTNVKFIHICEVIKYLSSKTYCTVGVVLNDNNVGELRSIIQFATDLGVSDIRIIPSAQYNRQLDIDMKTNYPILRHRLDNIKNGLHVRGLKTTDCSTCHLVKDDMVILHGYHFPCIIYTREQGNPIGKIENKTIYDIKKERFMWSEKTNCHNDSICRKNCLDFCIDYNNKVEEFKKMLDFL